ncbi:MAG: Rap1a/Tai family immunity protein [Chromatiales bacterium]|jgi:hypothetical protein
MMQRLFLALLLNLLLATNLPAADNFADLVANCKVAIRLAEAAADAPLTKDLHAQMQSEKCWTYLQAFQDALAWSAIKQASSGDNKPSMREILKHLPYCVPDHVTFKQQALILVNHAERNPEHLKWPAGAVFGEVMLNSFRCSDLP